MENKPLEFDEWKKTISINYPSNYSEAYKRLHGVDPAAEQESMLRAEYEEYLADFKGSWLL